MMPAKAGPLAVAAGVVGLGLFLFLGAFSIAGEAQYAGVGPRAFPLVVGAALAVLGVALAIGIATGRAQLTPEGGEDVDETRAADLSAMAWIVAGLVVAVFALERVGFALSAALVFTLTARAFGSRRLARDAAIGLALGVATYYLFARGLGVSLPAGPLPG
jgi:putative tricarboxylic transport membrane protein